MYIPVQSEIDEAYKDLYPERLNPTVRFTSFKIAPRYEQIIFTHVYLDPSDPPVPNFDLKQAKERIISEQELDKILKTKREYVGPTPNLRPVLNEEEQWLRRLFVADDPKEVKEVYIVRHDGNFQVERAWIKKPREPKINLLTDNQSELNELLNTLKLGNRWKFGSRWFSLGGKRLEEHYYNPGKDKLEKWPHTWDQLHIEFTK